MISDNITAIRERIAGACRRAGRPESDVTLLAVGKTFPASTILEAVRGGIGDVGENYVQELLAKQRALGGEPVRWHFIGHLQTNKVKQVLPGIRMIHAVDSVRLGLEIDRRAGEGSREVDCLIEVNTTGESTKYGVPPGEVAALARALGPCRHIRLAGLMTIGPFLPEAEGSRPMFRQLRELRDALQVSHTHMKHLSMGMTGDFEVAIEEGATIVRIGTAIFGPRAKADIQRRTP
ncbi:MAG TPA: YggS family pyridoxal phosphate-dependent enzyme [Bacteroidota bacterium]|nr:YggS family pyridoxal phosphate-dependent enzyme [Bacteroidota bacterium]